MTTQELEQKFNLIGDPIVRAVVRHLYDPEFIPNDVCELISQAETMLLRGFDWNKSKLPYGFFNNLYLHLIHNPNYSFNIGELQQVQKAYPELFNADGSLKESDIKGVWRDVYDSSEQKMGKGLDLQKLSDGLEKALANETKESLNRFFDEHPRQTVEEPKPELNRNEIALKIYLALSSNTNTEYVSFDTLAEKSYQAADAFIKTSLKSNNNK